MCANLKKISIIVPVYNTADYLRECLNSIISIPICDKEIIIINDGSTDDSLSIINEYVGKDITVITTANEGLSAARNRGLNISSGEYVLFVDSDDYILPNKIPLLIELADKYKTDVLLGRYIKCKETGEFLSESRMVSTVEVHLVTTGGEFYNGYSLNDATIIVACLKLCRRTFLQRNQILFVKGLYHEDVVFSFLCSKYATRIVQSDIAFYVYRQWAASIVHTPSYKKQVHKLFIADYICNNASESDSEFWPNLAIGLYFDVLRRTKLKNNQLFRKLKSLKKLRFTQKVKLELIRIIQIFASKADIKI